MSKVDYTDAPRDVGKRLDAAVRIADPLPSPGELVRKVKQEKRALLPSSAALSIVAIVIALLIAAVMLTVFRDTCPQSLLICKSGG